MNEEWRDIQGYEGLYQVSNLGRVRSCDRFVKCGYGKNRTVRQQIIKPSILNTGYYYVSLCREHTMKSFCVHRLEAIAFLPNPEKKKEIDHIDGNRLNNSLDNLRLVTPKENMNNPVTTQRVSDSHKGMIPSPESIEKRRQSNTGKKRSEEYKKRASVYNPCNKAVAQYTKDGEVIATFRSAAEAERQTGVHHPDIARVCKNKAKQAGGFIWRYK